MPQVAAPPGGLPRAVAKRGLERLLWTRVAVQGRWRRWRGVVPARPRPVPPTEVLRTGADWVAAVEECRRLRLPLHPDRPKNWDSLGAVATILASCGPDAAVLDAGAARYSPVLPWLRLYGLTDLVGVNLEFGAETRHGPVRFRHGDITATDLADASLDAVTCLSVIEHGVPVPAFLAEAARLLRPGGLLVVSTDYDQQPPDTRGLTAYGVPVHVFSPAEIRDLVGVAAGCGLRLRGELRLDHPERPLHWARTGLDFTYVRLTFERE